MTAQNTSDNRCDAGSLASVTKELGPGSVLVSLLMLDAKIRMPGLECAGRIIMAACKMRRRCNDVCYYYYSRYSNIPISIVGQA